MTSNKQLTIHLILATATIAHAADRDFSGVEIKTTHVAGHVYMLEGAGGNIGVSAGPDGILIVDDQFAPLAKKIRAAFSKLSPGKLKFVLNTHWHKDHTDGNREFGPDAPVIAQTNVRRRLTTEQRVFGRVVDPLPPEALPVITFDESLSLHFNGEEIHVVHYPHGHTDGDSVVFFSKSNVVHMGDNFFAGKFPFVDLGSGGDVVGLTKNVGEILEGLSPQAKIIPGHGPLSSPADLRDYHQMLVKTTDIVRKKMSQGKSLDQIKSDGLAAEWDAWGKGFISTDDWLETIHASLSKPGARQEE